VICLNFGQETIWIVIAVEVIFKYGETLLFQAILHLVEDGITTFIILLHFLAPTFLFAFV
jgi:hypothetical protein